MATVRFTPHLRRYFDLPEEAAADGATVAEVVKQLDRRWPGLGFYVTDEQGALRTHVAIWLDGRRVTDTALSDAVGADSTLHILQALSGG